MEKTDENYVKLHWDTQADGDIASDSVTLKDINQRWLEIDLILRYVDKRDLLLEIGCGNGYSTKMISKEVNFVHAIDFSEKMISRALKEVFPRENIKFEPGDVLNLKYPDNTFDVVVTERCLINLPSWDKQKKAIKNIAGVLKPGGRFILIEGLENGLEKLNLMRGRVGLKPIITAQYNVNFNEDLLLQAIKEDFEIIAIHKFGIFDFITRVVHPLLVYPDEPAYNAKINKIAREISKNISGFNECSRLIGLILKKR